MPTIDNPAGRLYAILTEAARNRKDNIPLKYVCPSIFEYGTNDTSQALSVTIQLMSLVAHTRECIETVQNIDTETYLKPIKEVEAAFASTTVQSHWGQFRPHITELEFCKAVAAIVKIGKTGRFRP